MRWAFVPMVLCLMAAAACGPEPASPVAGPIELLVSSSWNSGQELVLVATARNLGGLPVRYRGELCGLSTLWHIGVWIKSPSGAPMWLNNPLLELHGCGPTLQELAPASTVARTITLNGRLYARDAYDAEPVAMPPADIH